MSSEGLGFMLPAWISRILLPARPRKTEGMSDTKTKSTLNASAITVQSYTPEQMADILAWIALRAFHENKVPSRSHADRLDGKLTDLMIIYVITGHLMEYTLYSDMALEPVMNYYSAAPEWLQEVLTPLIAKWRAEAYKDPDYELPSNQLQIVSGSSSEPEEFWWS